MKLFTTLLMLCFSLSIMAQDLDQFERIRCEGKIPSYFTKYLEDKIDDDKKRIEGNSDISKKTALDFAAMTNFKLQQMLQSGKVLYGDPLTNYANKVFDKLRVHSDADLSDVQIYTLKSNDVNAFATDQGVLFITIGLWGQIENEAQLAFVLSHEITHYIENHNQLTYEYGRDIAKSGTYGKEGLSDYYKYSRENEEEADEAGYQLALDAGYDAKEAFNALNVLLYSYLPIDEMVIEKTVFNTANYTIPDKFFMEELDEISPEEDMDDEDHTHPNIASRKENLEAKLEKYADKESKIYQAGTEAEFQNLVDLARFEMMNTFMVNADFFRGLYHNMILSKKYPNNTFLNASRAMCWYGHVAYENANGTEYSQSYKKQEGEIQQLYHIFKKMDDNEFAALAVREVWNASYADTANKFLVDLRDQLMIEFAKNDQLSDYSKVAKKITTEEPEKEKSGNKYDKIAKKKKKSEEDFDQYIFVELFANDEFKESYRKAKSHNDDKEEEEDDIARRNDKPQKSKLDIERMVMVSPNYYKSDSRKDFSKNVINNEDNVNQLKGLVVDNANKLGIEMDFINDFKSSKFSTETYNDYSLLFDYLGERTTYPDHEYLPFYSQYTSQITEKYNTNYVGIIGIYTEIDKRPFNGSAFLLSAATLYAFPLYLKWQLTPEKYTRYGFLVYNINSDKPTHVSTNVYGSGMNIHLQNAHIYNSLNQITNSKK